MKKYLVISDLHGKEFKEIYDIKIDFFCNDFDKIILLGDYFDTYDYEIMKSKIQLKRFEEIFEIKARDSRIEVLLGNHETMYLWKTEEERVRLNYVNKCVDFEKEIKESIERHIRNKEINIAFETKKYIFSHQGINNMFMIGAGCKSIEEVNYKLHNREYEIFDVREGLRWWWNEGRLIKGYEQIDWLVDDMWGKKKQIVGHYQRNGVRIYDNLIAIENAEHGNSVIVME